MPRNGKTINSQYIEKQRKNFFKNFKKTLYINVRLSDENLFMSLRSKAISLAVAISYVAMPQNRHAAISTSMTVQTSYKYHAMGKNLYLVPQYTSFLQKLRRMSQIIRTPLKSDRHVL